MFGMVGVQPNRRAKPVLRLVDKRGRKELIPIILHHVRMGSTIMSDEWRPYRTLSDFGYNHMTVNHSRWFVDPRTGAHTQHIERAWRTVKEHVWRQRGNRTERLLTDHLCLVEWTEWLGLEDNDGPLGRLLHDIAKCYRV